MYSIYSILYIFICIYNAKIILTEVQIIYEIYVCTYSTRYTYTFTGYQTKFGTKKINM